MYACVLFVFFERIFLDMHLSSKRADTPAVASEGQSPVVLSERSLILLALVRIFVGLLWFQQLAWKMPPTFGGLFGIARRSRSLACVPSVLVGLIIGLCWWIVLVLLLSTVIQQSPYGTLFWLVTSLLYGLMLERLYRQFQKRGKASTSPGSPAA